MLCCYETEFRSLMAWGKKLLRSLRSLLRRCLAKVDLLLNDVVMSMRDDAKLCRGIKTWTQIYFRYVHLDLLKLI